MTPAEPSVTVCIVAGDLDEGLLRLTLESVTAHTPPEVEVRILGGSARDRQRDAPAHGDIVLVQAGCVVAADWLDGLRDAAVSDGNVATASALTQREVNVDPSTGFDGDAAVARTRSLRLRPRLHAARGPGVYVRRSALELIGERIAGGLSLAELSRQCAEAGLSHVLADDVIVLDRRPVADPPVPAGSDSRSVARAVGKIRRTIAGVSAVIDARILEGPTTGTHVHALEVAAGLARTGKVRLTVIVPNDPSEYAVERLESERLVSLVTYRQASSAGNGRADVVHRPFQLSNAGDLMFLRALGDRLILTQQDLIGYHNPSYFPDLDAWYGYRQLTALALASADRVAFFSSHARGDAIGEDLVDPARAAVVRLGADHRVAPADERPRAPAGAERLAPGLQTILCLGTDFHHKNRVFALRMLECLRSSRGWEGMLVLAGPKVAHGSSREREAALLAAHPGLAGAVLDVGAVSEAEKAWLFERSALVLYPSVIEGFGLVPFEAAAHGAPCMWAPGGALAEVLPDGDAGIVPWDAERSANRALELMRDDGARERNVGAILAAAEPLTWDATAAELVELYEATADAAATASPFALAGTVAEGRLGEDAMRLVGPGGELPPDVHRPLLALATHPRLAAPLFGALKLTYRASHRLQRERHKRR